MYPVSDKFKQEISQNARRFYWTGTITTKSGQVYTFENYSYTGEAAEVDSGLLTSLTLPFPEFDAINDVEVGE